MHASRLKYLRLRPELLFLVAIGVFVLTLVLRSTQDTRRTSLAVDLSGPAPVPVELGAGQTIDTLQARIRDNAEDTDAYAQLGLAFLQRLRETADASLYTQAETAFQAALQRDPQQLDALVGQGLLALGRHHFADALKWGEQALLINPYRAQIYGIIGDAQVELGQYDAAVATIQKMVDTRPDLSSYSRVSYQRELHGDVPGAMTAMQMAVEAGNSAAEQTRWTLVQLGHLYFNSGDLVKAEETYLAALQARPDYIYAYAGIARVRAAQGRTAEAIDHYKRIVEIRPLPEFVIALGELYDASGQTAQARQQYDLVDAMQRLNAEAGVDVDLELALFNADHGGNPQQAVAQARAVVARRPTIYAADALAWSLYQQGDFIEAKQQMDAALRLGTRDAMLHYHAGMIAYKLGDQQGARRHLEEALAINPYFSVRYAPEARKVLKELGAG